MTALAAALAPEKLVDLTQPLGQATVLWPGSQPFTAVVEGTHERDGGYWRHLSLPEHAGTHLDAPAHFAAGGLTVDQLELARLVRPAVVLDVRDAVGDDRDAAVPSTAIEAIEARDGVVPAGTVALVRTGWDRHLADPLAYAHDETGQARMPGLAADAAALLVDRGVVGIGIDTLSIDPGVAGIAAHRVTLPAGLWHLEGLVNLGLLPTRGAWIVAAPLRLVDGSGTPARVFAVLP